MHWDGNIENSSALNGECCKCPIFLTKDGGALCPNLCGTKDMRGRQSGEKLELTPATIQPRHSGVSQLSSTGLMTGATPDLNINNWCFVGTFIILSLLHL